MNASTMVGRGRRRACCVRLALITTALGVSLSAPARAQTSAYRDLDANGVDLVHGQFQLNFEEGSIGFGPGRLAVVRVNGDDRFASQWDGLVLYRQTAPAGGGYQEIVQISRDNQKSWETFTRIGNGAFASNDQKGTFLSGGGASYQYTAADGTVVSFGDPTNDPNKANDSLCPQPNPLYSCNLVPLAITSPAGVLSTLEYELASSSTDFDPDNYNAPRLYFWRLSRVSNSAGYAIDFHYVDTNPYFGSAPPQGWWRRAGASLSNAANNGGVVASVGYSYPGPSGMVDVTDPAGNTWRLTGTSIQRPGENTPGLQVTGNMPSAFAVTRDGVSTSYARNVSGNTSTTVVTDGLNHSTTIVANLGFGRPTQITDYLGHVTAYAYDGAGRLTRVTQPEGGYVQYTLDGRGNATETRQVAKSGSGLADLVATAVYDPTCTNAATCNQPTAVTDAGGHTTDFGYTVDGHVASVTAPAPTVGAVRPQTRYTYVATAAGTQLAGVSACRTGAAPACVGTADETQTSTSYDANGNLAGVTTAAGDGSLTATTAASWSPRGDVVSVDGPLPGSDDTVYYRYDADRRLVGTIAPDPDGTGPRSRRASRATYDAAGRPTLTEAGTVTGVSDAAWAGFAPAEGVATNWAGDRKTLDTLVAGGTAYARTQYGYDAAGRLECTAVRLNPAVWGSLPGACVAQAAGAAGPDRITRTSYDAVGSLTVRSAYGTTEQADEKIVYTPDGQVASVTDANGNKTSYGYDGHDRRTVTQYPSPTTPGTSNAGDYEQLGYDANGNVTARRLRDGQAIGYSYDALNRVVAMDRPNGVYWETDQSYAYDLPGHLTGAADSNGRLLTFGYDALGRRTSQGDNWYPYGNASYQYDAAGRRTRLTWADGFYVGYDYDEAGAMTAIRENGGTALASFGYDDLGRRTSLTRGNGVTTSYAYDPVSRLSSLGQDLNGTAGDLTLGFAYTPAGQIASRTSSNDLYAWPGAANVSEGYGVNGLNQYTSVGSTALGYDAKGNLSSSSGIGYTYTGDNLLAVAGSIGLAYDPAGRLFNVNSENGVNVTSTYDGTNLLAETDVATNALLRRYVFGPGGDEPLVWYEGTGLGDRRWLLADERGSVIAVTDASGNAIDIKSYDEFGAMHDTTPANGGRFGYTGQAWLPSLGLNYYKARMYSPSLGRFLQSDPIGYGDGLNWYNYVGGDPVNFTDPSGLAETAPSPSLGCTTEGATVTWCPGDITVWGGGGGGGGGRPAPDFGQFNFDSWQTRPSPMPPVGERPGVSIPLPEKAPEKNDDKPKPCPAKPGLPIPKGYVSADPGKNRYIRPAGSSPSLPPQINPAYSRQIAEQHKNFNMVGVFWDLMGIGFASVTGGLSGAEATVGAAASAAAGAGVATGQELSHAGSCPK